MPVDADRDQPGGPGHVALRLRTQSFLGYFSVPCIPSPSWGLSGRKAGNVSLCSVCCIRAPSMWALCPVTWLAAAKAPGKGQGRPEVRTQGGR